MVKERSQQGWSETVCMQLIPANKCPSRAFWLVPVPVRNASQFTFLERDRKMRNGLPARLGSVSDVAAYDAASLQQLRA